MLTGARILMLVAMIASSSCVKRIYVPINPTSCTKSLAACEAELDQCVKLADRLANP